MSAATQPASARRGRLLRKYLLTFVALVGGALLTSGGLEMWFSYQESKEVLAKIQTEKALGAAGRIDGFVDEVTRQVGWTTRAQWSLAVLDQRRLDYLQLLRQAPAITEIAHLDAAGREQLRVSRLSMDQINSGADLSADPGFLEAKARKLSFGPVYFRKESEPYMTVAMAGSGRDNGVTLAEVNLKFIWDVVTRIKVGKEGYAYVVDNRGLLIAHPDIGLVLRKTDLSGLPQVRTALDPGISGRGELIGTGLGGTRVLTAHAPIAPVGWTVFVDLPLAEALEPIYASLRRTATLMLLGLVLAAAAGIVVARRIILPIRALQAGAERIGAGDLGHRIAISTGDELQDLSERFNDMADRLAASHAGLEHTVQERTRALAQTVRELNGLREVGEAVASSLDLRVVLETVIGRAVDLAGADAGAVFRYRARENALRLWRAARLPSDLANALRSLPIPAEGTAMAGALREGAPVRVEDMAALSSEGARHLTTAGYRSAILIPLTRAERPFGVLAVFRHGDAGFDADTVRLLQAFASQSVVAIQNARLFREIEEKGRQLEIASQHKSQFLANMSHELRTPLNAILGYSELLADGLYGELTEKQQGVLERVQNNGRHLLGLINDVLDLSKIEAGQLELAVDDYALASIARSVVSATESLAAAKGLDLALAVEEDLPAGRGDERRLTQVLLNLVGNAIKFTDKGRVEIRARRSPGGFSIDVSDTGPGIDPEDQAKIFEEFQQVDNTSTRQKGGTGLGLAISRRIVEMHGGRLSVESVPGAGSTFRVDLPIVAEARAAA